MSDVEYGQFQVIPKRRCFLRADAERKDVRVVFKQFFKKEVGLDV